MRIDGVIAAAARALASGDPLGALNLVALRDDPHALALRGIAMAQLGDLPRARSLLRRAGSGFGSTDAVARARCVVAEAEIALVSRDLGWTEKPLQSARLVLSGHGDAANAAHAGYLEARFLLLIGRLDDAERLLAGIDLPALPVASRAAAALVSSGIAVRRLRVAEARSFLAEARRLAARSAIPGLMAEVENASARLDAPVAWVSGRAESSRALRLDDVEALVASGALVVDACRHAVLRGGTTIRLGSRPVLFALVRSLAEAWPDGEARETLLARAFRAREADESHRARLRVDIGRLRRELRGVASIGATRDGFALLPEDDRAVVVITPSSDEAHATVLALLGDGEAWSSSALAMALAVSPRTVQRALDDLLADGKVRSVGQGPGRRWLAVSSPGFPTALLLPVAQPDG